MGYILKKLLIIITLVNLTSCFNKITFKNNPKNYLKNKKMFMHSKNFKTQKMNNKLIMSESKTNNFVADMERRSIMNVLLLTSIAVPVGWMLVGFLYFFVPASTSNIGSGILAKDKDGNDINVEKWIKENPFPNRNLVQGLKGDAHYLIVKSDKTIENYAINAVCTHLGCVVPWNKAVNKYMCPCHGSQYDETGKVIRGPAPKSLALANVNIIENKVLLTEYNELDFRTNTNPWWIK